MAVPDRLRWALDVLDPAPDEQLLEVGCGVGVCAELVCERLTTGRLLAVDRSATAVARTTSRCAAHLAAGCLVVRQCPLAELDVAPASIDGAFAVDVNAFWTGPADAELVVLRRALRPGGRVHLLYGAGGPTDGGRVTTSVAGGLRRHGLHDVTTIAAPAGLGVSARARV